MNIDFSKAPEYKGTEELESLAEKIRVFLATASIAKDVTISTSIKITDKNGHEVTRQFNHYPSNR